MWIKRIVPDISALLASCGKHLRVILEAFLRIIASILFIVTLTVTCLWFLY